jgi:hypothetical protein
VTGPEGYREALTYLAMSDEKWDQPLTGDGARDIAFALGSIRDALVAQVHATLALAAATALASEGLPRRDDDAWFAAAATQPSEPGAPT